MVTPIYTKNFHNEYAYSQNETVTQTGTASENSLASKQQNISSVILSRRIKQVLIEGTCSPFDKMCFQLGRVLNFENLHCSEVAMLLTPSTIKHLQDSIEMISISSSSLKSVHDYADTVRAKLYKLKTEVDAAKTFPLKTKSQALANTKEYSEDFDENEYQHNKIREKLNALACQLKMQLAEAGVSSPQELVEKSAKISSYKSQAKQHYFNTSEALACQQEMDETMSLQFGMNDQEREVITSYWDLMSHIKKGGKLHELFESYLQTALELLTKHSTEILIKPISSLKNSDWSIDCFEELYRSLSKALEKTMSQATNGLEQNPEVYSYFLLKGRILLSPVLKMLFHRCLTRAYNNTIQMHKFELKLMRAELSKKNGYEMKYENCMEFAKTSESSAWILKLAMEYEEKGKKERVSLEKKLANLKQGRECEDLNLINPQEIKAIVQRFQLTSFEKMVVKSLEIVCGPLELDQSKKQTLWDLDRDINVDLTQVSDPVAYFISLEKERTQARLALLKPLKAVILNE